MSEDNNDDDNMSAASESKTEAVNTGGSEADGTVINNKKSAAAKQHNTYSSDEHEEKWMIRLQELIQFKETHGHCRVPQKAHNPVWNPKLGQWVSAQRKAFKHGKLKAHRFTLLNDLGFYWSATWAKGRQTNKVGLSGIHNVAGDDDSGDDNNDDGSNAILDDDDDNDETGNNTNSIVTNAMNCKTATATATAAAVSPRAATTTTKKAPPKTTNGREVLVPRKMSTTGEAAKWSEMFQKLRKYKVENGHCNVPLYCPEEPQLGHFVDGQREEMKKLFLGRRSKLKWDQYCNLERLGFQFGMRSW